MCMCIYTRNAVTGVSSIIYLCAPVRSVAQEVWFFSHPTLVMMTSAESKHTIPLFHVCMSYFMNIHDHTLDDHIL